MKYDPVKDRLFALVKKAPFLPELFFGLLDVLLLRQRYVKRELKLCFKDGQSFLDAGAGFCQYSDFVLNKYPHAKVMAIDLKSDYLESYAFKADSRFSYMTKDLQCFDTNAKYDLAVAIDILEHIEDDVAVLNNLYKALNDGGFLIISTPSNLDEAARFTEEHVRPGYSMGELSEKVNKAGFKIVRKYYSYGFFGALSWKMMLKTPLSMLNKSKFSTILLPFYYLLIYPFSELLMQLDLAVNNKKGNGIILLAKK